MALQFKETDYYLKVSEELIRIAEKIKDGSILIEDFAREMTEPSEPSFVFSFSHLRRDPTKVKDSSVRNGYEKGIVKLSFLEKM